MGIKDLNNFLKLNTKNSITSVHLETLAGKRVAIDTSLYFYKFLYKSPRFLEQFFEQIYRLKKFNITPVYIFDGKPPDEKNTIIEQRKIRKEIQHNKLIELKNKIDNYDSNIDNNIIINNDDNNDDNNEDNTNTSLEELNNIYNKMKKKLIYVTNEHVNQLKYFLNLLNIKYIQADCEADVICSNLYINKKVDMVLSDDMDLLVSGTCILLREFNINSNNVTLYNLNSILDELSFTKQEWIDFCILCGCDYLSRIPYMGVKTSFKFIKECGNIENIIEKYTGPDKKYTLPNNYNYENARDLFNKCKYYYNEYNNLNLDMDELFTNQLDNIRIFLKKYTNITNIKIENRLKVIYSNLY